MSKKEIKRDNSADIRNEELHLALKNEEQNLKEISSKIKSLNSNIKDNEKKIVELFGYTVSDSSSEKTKAYAKNQIRVLRDSIQADNRELKKLSEERLLYREKISSINAEIAKNKSVALQEDIHLDIPEDEIWTYQVPGLAAPHINKPYKHYNLKKAVFAIVIVIAVSLSIFFSVLALQNETFEYEKLENGYQFTKFSNNGFITELEIDYVSEIEYIPGNNDPATNFNVVKDESKPVVSVRQFTLNCDDKITKIKIGPQVEFVDAKAFYSCWALQTIEVDENNPNYSSVDGVLYNKDKTEVLCYPCDHDEYLRQKYGYEKELFTDEITPEYERDIQTYVVPSTVKKIGEMCFNYANLKYIYLPEGLETIETLAIFKLHERKDEWGGTNPSLKNVYSYKADGVNDTHFTSQEALGEVYLSLPEGLKYIGSDAFSYNQNFEYVYIPSSVTYIGHNAFWDTCYKEGDTLKGVTEMNVAVSEDQFDNNTVGDDWVPKYDYMLFKKAININYSAQRKPMA